MASSYMGSVECLLTLLMTASKLRVVQILMQIYFQLYLNVFFSGIQTS